MLVTSLILLHDSCSMGFFSFLKTQANPNTYLNWKNRGTSVWLKLVTDKHSTVMESRFLLICLIFIELRKILTIYESRLHMILLRIILMPNVYQWISENWISSKYFQWNTSAYNEHTSLFFPRFPYFHFHHRFSVTFLICLTLSIPRIKSAAFSAIIIVGAFVFPDGILRMTEASDIRRFFIPITLQFPPKHSMHIHDKKSFVNFD